MPCVVGGIALRFLLVTLAIVPLVLAGCTGPKDLAVEPSSAEGATVTPANGSPPVDNASTEPAPPVDVPVQISATIPTGMSVCERTPTSFSCGNNVGDFPFVVTEVPLSGFAHSFELTLTWTATTPAGESLVFSAITCTDDGCDRTSLTGRSPLVLSLPDATHAEELTLIVGPEGIEQQDRVVYASTGQAIEIAGNVRVVRAA